MNTDTEKQFAGNYVRLVNQNRQLQQAFDNSTQLNNKLHDEIRLKDKMLNLMANDLYNSYYDDSVITVIMKYKLDSQKLLIAEQNKKAAGRGSNEI